VIPIAQGGRAAGRSYTQIYRTGVLESLWLLPNNTLHRISEEAIPIIQGDGWIPNLLGLLPKYLSGLNELGAVLPFFVFLSFLSIRGFYLFGPKGGDTNRPFNQDQILLPELYLEEATPIDIRKAIKRPLDILWNAVGAETNPYM
jgi:hypothetical protein